MIVKTLASWTVRLESILDVSAIADPAVPRSDVCITVTGGAGWLPCENALIEEMAMSDAAPC